eukprot:TRINITY_DN22892_c0_g1_i1.p1 TRINITY_DN22892_c0_g1~~TRINITY_DN22892_c0_g1_i1.p1  ORF type:complete len:387 (+),score=116.01 TRINITY_DN22892_c0_g1_i1:101-1261(+)
MSTGPLAIDFIEFWCGDADVSCDYYCSKFLFQRKSRKDTPVCRSRCVGHGDAVFVFTSSPTDERIAEHVALHGDSSRDIALRVADVPEAFSRAVDNGAIPLSQPERLEDEHGVVVRATIGTPFGPVVHTLIDRSGYRGRFLPGYCPEPATPPSPTQVDVTHVDHVSLAFPVDTVALASEWYARVLGFERFVCDDDEPAEDGMNMSVRGAQGGLRTCFIRSSRAESAFKFVLVEPLPPSEAGAAVKSQVQEFLDNHNGAGVQHLALHTNDIVATVGTFCDQGVKFITVPTQYYENLFSRDASFLKSQWQALERLGILVDVTFAADDKQRTTPKYIMQTFTHPIDPAKPAFFLEVISRKGSSGFGKRTIKALFEAVEKIQQQRLLVER